MSRASSSVLLLSLCIAISAVSPVICFSAPHLQLLPRTVPSYQLWSACAPPPKLKIAPGDSKGTNANHWLSAPSKLAHKFATTTVLAFVLLTSTGDSQVVAAPLSEIECGSGGMLLADVAPKYLSKPLGKHWDGGGSVFRGRDWFEEHPTHEMEEATLRFERPIQNQKESTRLEGIAKGLLVALAPSALIAGMLVQIAQEEHRHNSPFDDQ